jgi:hypothetical protein
MGYADYSSEGQPGIANSLAVHFDTYPNPPDPNGNYVSVQTRGVLPNDSSLTYSLGYATLDPYLYLKDGYVHTARIQYSPGTLSVFVDDLVTLTVSLDLGGTLDLDNGRAWVGFTAGTGEAYENHDILSWSFTPEPATLSLLALGGLALMRRRRLR